VKLQKRKEKIKKKDGPCLVGYNLDAEGMVEKKECKG